MELVPDIVSLNAMTLSCFVINLVQNLKFMAVSSILSGDKTFDASVNQEGYLIPVTGW